MTLKREAAYHEAGHALMARLSKFHEVISGIDLADYGAGEVFISLSKRKLKSAGKPVDLHVATEPEVARDLALILVAGYVAEKLANSFDQSLVPSLECAKPDHKLLKQQLSNAGLSNKFDRFESDAEDILKSKWKVVNSLAERIFKYGAVDFERLNQMLNELVSDS